MQNNDSLCVEQYNCRNKGIHKKFSQKNVDRNIMARRMAFIKIYKKKWKQSNISKIKEETYDTEKDSLLLVWTG